MTRLWTQEEDDLLLNALEQYRTIAEIALLLDRSVSAVSTHMSHKKMKAIKRGKRKSVNNKTQHETESLCWSCRKATKSECVWSESLEAVPGWKIKMANGNNGRFYVISCPEFVEG